MILIKVVTEASTASLRGFDRQAGANEYMVGMDSRELKCDKVPDITDDHEGETPPNEGESNPQ